MIFIFSFRFFIIHFIFVQLNVNYVTTSWPSSNGSNIRLLGLFPDVDNISESTELSVHSRAMFKSAIILSHRYNLTIDEQFIEWETAQTGGDVIGGLSQTCESVSDTNIVGIVGPSFSREAHLISAFGDRVGIPVISYGATDPDLSDRNKYSTFYRTVPSDNAAALAIMKLFVRFNWTSCIIIYQNDAFGTGGSKILNEIFIRNGLTVREMILFDIVTRHIRGNLKNTLYSSATRIVVVWIETDYIYDILDDGLQSDVVGPQFTWILSSTVSLDRFNKIYHEKLIGILTIEPVIGSIVDAPTNITLLNEAYQIWKDYEAETFPNSSQVNSYALFAFDATWLLIKSLEEYCSQTPNISLCYSFIGSSYCFDRHLIYSDLLFDIINKIEFLGVSGLIKFSNNTTDRINGSYYYCQNVQPSSNGLKFIPVLDYSDLNDWKVNKQANIILWPGKSLTQPTGRATLNGVKLRVGVIEVSPFTMMTNIIDANGQRNRSLVGYVPDLIEILREKMGFIPYIELVSSNKTYSDFVKSVANGSYDIIVGDVTITSQRRELVGFSNSIFDNSLRIMMKKTSNVTNDIFAFLKPLSGNLWLLILAACIFGGILICLIEREDNVALQNLSLTRQFGMSLWYSFANIVGFGADFNVNTNAGRLLTIGLYILGLVLIASYTANLASNLTISKSINIISKIDDIRNGKIPLNRIGIRVGTASEEYFLREISHGSKNYYPLRSKQDTFDALLFGFIDVSFVDIGVAEYVTNNVYCNLTSVGAGFDTGAFGIVTQKNWLYLQELDVNILSLRERGIIDKLREKWFQIKTCPDSSQTTTAIGISSMIGLFLIFAIICLLSLLSFGWIKRQKIKKNSITLVNRYKFSKNTKASTDQ